MQSKHLLIIGLTFILGGVGARSLGVAPLIDFSLIGIGVAFKVTFLILSIRTGTLKLSAPLIVLLGGVTLTLISLLLKYLLLLPAAAKPVLCTGIVGKTVALFLFAFRWNKKQ